jgi:DNA-binding MarR family transcriptional regulator
VNVHRSDGRRKLSNAKEPGPPVLPCACANLRRASRALTQFYDRTLRSAGLNMPQFTLLQTLATTGSVTQGRLGQILVLDSTTLSRTLRPLQRKGWIRTRTGNDRRERRIELTDAGRAQFRRATPAWNRAERRVLAQVGRARLDTLMAELTAIARLSRLMNV